MGMKRRPKKKKVCYCGQDRKCKKHKQPAYVDVRYKGPKYDYAPSSSTSSVASSRSSSSGPSYADLSYVHDH